ncbi:MAG: ADP-ribose pyrophosphatase [Methanomassiliicoccales archaeon PtaU1.Bin124]|nr:MAG: ADP-ribose pyrophosphatase [Methanomassiliicoccales archaeon PtaU1.Bin124]
MGFEPDAELVLRKDGKVVLDAILCSLIETVQKMGDIDAVAKAFGIPDGDVVGIIDSINGQSGTPLVEIAGNSLLLTPEGKEAISTYRLNEGMLRQQLVNLWMKPWITTDGVVLVDGKLVLIRRGKEPFLGMYALPGGIVEYGETLERCVVREVKEETGLDVEVIGLAGTYSDPQRDPRGHFITVVFNLRHVGGELKGGDDAAEAFLFPLDRLPELAADHARIVSDALKVRQCP